MKKYSIYALMGAIALAGSVGFTSCSSSSDEVITNPDYNPEENSVKTQFAITLPSNVTGKTRQSGDIVQSAENITSFRGMNSILLYPFSETGNVNADPVTSSSTAWGDVITLKGLVKPDNASAPEDNTIPAASSGLLNNSNAVLFNDVTIPTGTGSFLFYGKAIETGTDKFVNGSLEMTGTTPATFTFTPTQIYPSATTASAVGTALVTYMSDIAQAANWSDCADNSSPYYNAGLGDLYTKFTGQKAGSSLTVQALIQDVYNQVKSLPGDVAAAIKGKILNSTYVTDTSNPDQLTFNQNLGNSYTTGDGKTLYFPFDVNLPDGAALLSYDSSNKTFSQVTNGNGNIGSVTAAYANYAYPASLYYYANSGIKTATSSQMTNYDGTKTWDQILSGYSGTSVLPGTRSVAILDAIQYAVGRLDMTIKTASNTLYDKNGETYDATNGFTVTGVLIGGQKSVGFDFVPKGTDTWTLYDNIQKSQSTVTLTATTTKSAVNYTLALETAANTTINVAIELVNKGASFHGSDGVIPAGCKFYLVASLNPSEDKTTDGDKVTGTANTGNKVFKQDYKTIADFNIVQGTSGVVNSKGLGAAYNTIPDLRSPELELGLSVNLTWQEGIKFELDI